MFAVLRGAAMHTHQMPFALQPFAMQNERQAAFAVVATRVTYRLPSPLIPQHDGTAAILALGNGAFETAVIERMILDMHGEPFVGGIETGATRDGPAFERTIHFQPEI